MNNKGQVIALTFMIALVLVLLALGLAPAVKEQVDTSRGTMDCDNDSISTYDKAGCLVADISMFQFIAGIIFLAGGVVAAKVIL